MATSVPRITQADQTRITQSGQVRVTQGVALPEIWPEEIGFVSGEAGQRSFSLYLHGSPDGGHELFTAAPFDPAVWDSDDGGIGVQAGDSAPSFCGHREDDAGTGGPYSTRLASLVLRPQPTPSRAYRVTMGFLFDASGSGERIGVLLRCTPETLTTWNTRGKDGTEKPNYFESLIAGYLVVVEQAGFCRVYEYDTAGARTLITSAAVTITAGTSQTLEVEVSDDDAPKLTVRVDAADPFAGDVSTAETSPTRAHVGFVLTNTSGSDYPMVESFQIEDMVPVTPILVLRDLFKRVPVALTGTIVPVTADGRATATALPHKLHEWGGHRLSVESTEDIGPRIVGGVLVFGPDIGAPQITANTRHEFVNLQLNEQDTADQFVTMGWRFESTGADWLFARVAVGIALRATKSAKDGDPPSVANTSGYIFRAVFESPEPYFEIVRLVAGTATRIGAKRPFGLLDILEGEVHQFGFEVRTVAGDVFLSAAWRKPNGDLALIFDLEEDDDVAKIVTADNIGHAIGWSSMGGQNLRIGIQRFINGTLGLAPPTITTEAVSAGPSPHTPSFTQPTSKVYQIVQEKKERGYTASRPTYAQPRKLYEATWILDGTDAAVQLDFLQERAVDGKSFGITLEDGEIEFILANHGYPHEQATPDLFRIGPVPLIEVL